MIIWFFSFQFIYMMDYIDRFVHVEPALHLWDEAHLIIMDNFSNVFLDSVCQDLLRIFASMFMSEIGLYFSSLVVSLCGFGIRVTVAS